jgi:hypothetical protein
MPGQGASAEQVLHRRAVALEAAGRDRDLAQFGEVSPRVLLDQGREEFVQRPLLCQPRIGRRLQRVRAERAAGAAAACVRVEGRGAAAVAEVATNRLIRVDAFHMGGEPAQEGQILTM